MSNMFSIFDPVSSILKMNLNWLGAMSMLAFLPSSYWMTKSKNMSIYIVMTQYLKNKFTLYVDKMKTPGLIHLFTSIIIFIMLNNFLGLFPYVFTSSSYLSFSVSLALPMWLGAVLFYMFKSINYFLAPLVSLDTPPLLMPFMVVIEFVSSSIRPLTLSIRLVANMVAGHMLMVVISSPMSSLPAMALFVALMVLVLLLMLEVGVSFIQAYVFSALMSLHTVEINSPKVPKYPLPPSNTQNQHTQTMGDLFSFS